MITNIAYTSHTDLAKMCIRSYYRSSMDYPFPVVEDIEAFGMLRGKTMTISFRGTNSLWDALRDVRVYPWKVETPLGHKVWVHTGFYKGARIWSERNLRLLQKEFDFNSLELTGHSLGAALAVQFAIQNHHILPISQIALFGEPKGLFKSSQQYFADVGLAAKTASYREGNDGVTYIPFWGKNSTDGYIEIGRDGFYDHDINEYPTAVYEYESSK